MLSRIGSLVTLALLLGSGIGFAQAQDSSNAESLGDLARQVKAQRAKSHERSKVYTNDDLGALSPLPELSIASPVDSPATLNEEKPGTGAKAEAQPVKGKSGNEADKASGNEPTAQSGDEPHDEKYYGDRMSKLNNRLDTDQRELSVLEQKLGQNELLYYQDPSRGLYQESGPTAMADVRSLQDRIARKKNDIETDQAAIEDLREQLRREGGDPGWLR